MATRCSSFEVHARADAARTGTLTLPHGRVPTPAFMPVGTAGSVKGLTPRELVEIGADMVLANTFHLWVRPGHERVQRLGGLHRLMAWERPILTDSGGFQAFSFRDKAKVKEEGVRFLSTFDRQWRFMTPEVSVEIQEALGVDVAMALDECIELTEDRRRVKASTERTTRWLQRCLDARRHPERTALFGIVQGGFFPDLRVEHARRLADMDLDGYAVGGVSVGEPQERMMEAVELAVPELPADRVRYLMGVGYPTDIVEAVSRGIDLFDCVLPTRTARFGYAFTRQGRLAIKHARFTEDARPIDPACACYTCRSFSRAYLRHLHRSKEMLAPRLLTLHNLAFYQDLMRQIRAAIVAGPEALASLRQLARRWQEPYEDA
ncbi:MAG: tRNA guanosine(34) transglycosylase Tgt [Alphaproteobacteria bacterium]|nr:tRNA guanosine(34) transglycosylase Tgt [Alphaproteobacteria bacterium]MCB9791653.1 tRNA guanosine(34) transglycosylase Tgt [Alphaproteobacteria bacterium]